jgi:hypothetical protein
MVFSCDTGGILILSTSDDTNSIEVWTTAQQSGRPIPRGLLVCVSAWVVYALEDSIGGVISSSRALSASPRSAPAGNQPDAPGPVQPLHHPPGSLSAVSALPCAPAIPLRNSHVGTIVTRGLRTVTKGFRQGIALIHWRRQTDVEAGANLCAFIRCPTPAQSGLPNTA